jgi:sugar/nucleoside kinase (ribokinase family)
MESSAAQIPAAYLGARGLYVFRTHRPVFWASLRALPAPPAEVILWEIAADAALPELRPLVAQVLPLVEILSINRTEALRLYGLATPREALHAALDDGARVVALRLGAAGSLVTDGTTLLEVPAAPAQVVDVTGGGNAYSGGFLAGYCGAAGLEGEALERAARGGAAAAALVIEQYGPPPIFDDNTFLAARRRASTLPIVRSAFH